MCLEKKYQKKIIKKLRIKKADQLEKLGLLEKVSPSTEDNYDGVQPWGMAVAKMATIEGCNKGGHG